MKTINLIQICILILGFQNFCTAADVNDRRCRLPEFPPNGRYKVTSNSSNYNYAPHSYVNEYTTLDVECNPGSKRNNILYSICIGSTWYPTLPTCFKTCPTLRSTPTTTFTCSLNDVVLDNCESPIEGTTAVIKCAEFYEGPGSQFSLPPECRNGKWDFNIFYCQPICGVKHQEAVPNLIGAVDAQIGTYPWQVAVYNKHEEQICGGAILSTHIVLSAAHCFSNPENGDILPKENYMLASRKYFRTFQHPGDYLAQYSAIKEIKFPLRYKGSVNRYEADIAIVFLVTPFTLSVAVQPVCFDLTNSHEHEELIASRKGVVSGWGESEEGRNPSETLKELEIPFIDYDLCYDSVPNNFKTFITYDKICGGYLGEGKSVCRGDSGGAFSFQYKKDSRYYVRGIISLSPKQNQSQCDSNQYSVFTKVSKFRDMIVRSLRESQYLLSYCGAETFRCASGECIPKRSECDGIIDCQDKSDETDTCKNKPCNNNYFFRCNYGACINKNATCDGKQDCRDNSDEDSAECSISTSPLPESNQCRLPEFPLNGKYYALRGIMEYKSGTYVDEATLLSIKCDPGYKKETGRERYFICLNGVWNPEPPKCVRTCPSLNSTATTTFTCKLNGYPLPNCDFPINGAVAEIKCANFYEKSGVHAHMCIEGSWDTSIGYCLPTCGRKYSSVTSQIPESQTNSFPWQVTVYDDKRQQRLCMGAILSPRVAISAAHCFTNFTGEQLPNIQDYLIAAGKRHERFDDPADITAQYSKIKELTIPERFKGGINLYEGDMVIIILSEPFTLSAVVQPICFDATNSFEQEQLNSSNKGVIPIWRPNVRNINSELSELEIPFVDYVSCYEAVPLNFRRYLTHDKICGGHNTCKGDSGTILSFPYVDGRYYMRGILSTSPTTEPAQECKNNTNEYSLFTKTSTYQALIAQKLKQFQ